MNRSCPCAGPDCQAHRQDLLDFVNGPCGPRPRNLGFTPQRRLFSFCFFLRSQRVVLRIHQFRPRVEDFKLGGDFCDEVVPFVVPRFLFGLVVVEDHGDAVFVVSSVVLREKRFPVAVVEALVDAAGLVPRGIGLGRRPSAAVGDAARLGLDCEQLRNAVGEAVYFDFGDGVREGDAALEPSLALDEVERRLEQFLDFFSLRLRRAEFRREVGDARRIFCEVFFLLFYSFCEYRDFVERAYDVHVFSFGHGFSSLILYPCSCRSFRF